MADYPDKGTSEARADPEQSERLAEQMQIEAFVLAGMGAGVVSNLMGALNRAGVDLPPDVQKGTDDYLRRSNDLWARTVRYKHPFHLDATELDQALRIVSVNVRRYYGFED